MTSGVASVRTDPVVLLVGTKKGVFFLRGEPDRGRWSLDDPHFLGHIAHHVVLDPRDRRTLLVAANTGHFGPTVFRSLDFGKSWSEASAPPAFRKAPEGEKGRAVGHVFWLQPASAEEPDTWYAGTSPPALFRSEDGGQSWEPVSGWNDHAMWATWTEDGEDGTPDGSILHSINVVPRDPQHLYFGTTAGQIWASRDEGDSWTRIAENLPHVYSVEVAEIPS